jgi:hypothetical protein
MAAIIRETEAKSANSFVPRSGGLLNDIVSKARSTGADSFEVGFALSIEATPQNMPLP